MGLQVLKTDRFFYSSPNSGDPDCLCSRCLKQIPEHESPIIRLWPTEPGDHGFDPNSKEGTEFRYCYSCLRAMGVEGFTRSCKDCGCTDQDACVHPEAGNCSWVTEELCSHCRDYPGEATRYSKILK
jgi:hypothetical protein